MIAGASIVETLAMTATGITLIVLGLVAIARRRGLSSGPPFMLVAAGLCLVAWQAAGYVDMPWDGRAFIAVAEPLFLLLASAGLFVMLGSLFPRYAGMLEKELTARQAAELETQHALQRERLLADVLSHDVKNMLTGALLRLDVLKMKHPEFASGTSMVAGPLQRAAELIDKSILFLRLEHGDVIEEAPTDIRVLVRAAVDTVSPMAEQNAVAVQSDVAPAVTITANALLGRAIENVLSNAVKWSPPGGSVRVRVSEGGDLYRIEISDQGPGIPPAERERIFGRFERADEHGVQGTGLGLAIAHRVVEMHDGMIWVEDTPGGGSTFVMQFPTHGAVDPMESLGPLVADPPVSL